MKFLRFSKFAAAALLIAAGAGCETMPGDPYYADRYAPAPVYGGAYGGSAVYPSGAYPVYPAYPVVDRDRRDRFEDMRDDRERRAWRERQRDRERMQRDERARRDLERQRDRRSELERQRDRRNDIERQRDRDLAQREADRRARQDADQRNSRAYSNGKGRRQDGSLRTDFDNYNPKTGSWLIHSDFLP